MSKNTQNHTHLWNDLPKDERERLMPYEIECQKRHMLQCKEVAIRNHKRHIKELDEWIKNLDRELSLYNK